MNNISKKICAALLSFVFVIGSLPVTTFAAQNTFDLSVGVYDISTEADLLAFREALDNKNYFENATVNLLQDITMTQPYVTASYMTYDAAFCGTFEGHNHTISNLNMVSNDSATTGLFPLLWDGTVKDLTLENVTINDGYTRVGAIAPLSMGEDKIINCHITGNSLIKNTSSFSGNTYMGGFVGDKYQGSLEIENCTLGEDVEIIGSNSSGDAYTGGFVGFVRHKPNELTIKNCVNKADVQSDDFGAGFIGIASSKSGGENTLLIENCVNYGAISATSSASNMEVYLGGIVGQTGGYTTLQCDRCFNFGDITCQNVEAAQLGGVVVELHMGSVTNCFNAGNITAPRGSNGIGGVVGQPYINTNAEPVYIGGTDVMIFPSQKIDIMNCYNTGNITATRYNSTTMIGGVCGNITGSSSQLNQILVNNCYSYGTINFTNQSGYSTGNDIGDVCGAVRETVISDVYSKQNIKAIGAFNTHDTVETTNSVGYYDSAAKGGKVYPATVPLTGDEVISSTPLDTDLKDTLDKYVDEKNTEFKANSNSFRYLPWTYSDGSDGLGIHPVFGYDIKNLDPESDKNANGGYLTPSKMRYEHFELVTDDDKTVTVTATPNAGYSLKSLTVTDQNGNNVALTKVDDTTYTFTMPEADVTVDAEWEQAGEPENYVYLTTKDSVDINFEIDADYYTSDPNAYVELEYNHRNRDVYTVDRRVQRVNLKDVTDDAKIDGRYKFTIESAPAQLTEKINVTLKDSQGNELYKVEDYSMWKYCDEIIQDNISIHQTDAPQDVKDKMEDAADVCKALTDYATVAQVYFNYNTSDMSSKSVAKRQPTYYTENVTNERTFHNINTVSENQMLGMSYGGAVARVEGELPFEIVETTLMSLANTEVRFYYDTDINPSDYELSLSVDDKWYGSARPSASFGTAASGNFIVVGGIESSNLDNTFNLTIRDKNTGKTATIHYSALAYCYTVLRDTKDNADPKVQQLRSLVKSVYLYNTYAQQYFVG